MRRSGLTRSSVYSQKLPDSYKSTDISDDSAIVTLPPSFDNLKKGKPYSIERPSFKMATANAIIDESKRTANLKNKRTGLGNNLIIRQSFLTPSVLGRQATDFALQELMEQQQQGIKVQLGDKTLGELFRLVTVDPDDKEWLAIYATELRRLMDDGKSEDEAKEILKVSPPLGRPQRPITKMVNFGSLVNLSKNSSSLSITEKLDALTVAVKSLSDLDLPTTLATIMTMITSIESFTPEQCAKITDILDSTKSIPVDYASYGFTHAIFSLDQYEAEEHRVNIFLGANIPSTLNSYKPVSGTGGFAVEWKQIRKTLKQVYNAVDQNGDPIPASYGYYLYLPYRQIISRKDAIDLVNSGVDSGQLNGIDPPDPDPLVGGSPHWLSEAEEAEATKKKSLKSPEPLGGDPLSLDVDEPLDPTIPVDPLDPFKSPPPKPPKEKVPVPPPTPTRPWEAGARIPVATSTERKANNFQYYLAVNKSQYTMENPSLTPAVVKSNLTEIWNRFTKEEKARWTDANNGVGSSSSKA